MFFLISKNDVRKHFEKTWKNKTCFQELWTKPLILFQFFHWKGHVTALTFPDVSGKGHVTTLSRCQATNRRTYGWCNRLVEGSEDTFLKLVLASSLRVSFFKPLLKPWPQNPQSLVQKPFDKKELTRCYPNPLSGAMLSNDQEEFTEWFIWPFRQYQQRQRHRHRWSPEMRTERQKQRQAYREGTSDSERFLKISNFFGRAAPQEINCKLQDWRDPSRMVPWMLALQG